MILDKKFERSSLFAFFENRPRNVCLGMFLDRKEAFLDKKNMYLICPKNRKFSKGVNPRFW